MSTKTKTDLRIPRLEQELYDFIVEEQKKEERTTMHNMATVLLREAKQHRENKDIKKST